MPLYETDNLNADEAAVPGIVNGMAYSSSGIGGVLPIEASQMPGQGNIRLTGILQTVHLAFFDVNVTNLYLSQDRSAMS